MFNPDPKIEVVSIPGHRPCIVVDDFLTDPESFVQYASASRGLFAPPAYIGYPGIEMEMPRNYSQQLASFFSRYIRQYLNADTITDLFSRFSMVTLRPEELRPLQRICHRDRLITDPSVIAAASVLYLFRETNLGGTSFYVPKLPLDEIDRLFSKWKTLSSEEFTKAIGAEPSYMTSSNDYFELVCTVPAAWNRIIFYEGTIFHSGQINAPEKLCPDPLRGRLSVNSFLACRRSTVA